MSEPRLGALVAKAPQGREQRMRSLILTVLVCAAAGTLSGCSSADSAEVVAVGSPAPGFTLKALDGATVTSRALAGQPVILNFWATWCAPCLKEIPDLKQVAASSGAKVIGIALDEGGAPVVKPFVAKHEINYTVLLGDQELFQRFNGLGIPYTLVLDRAQNIFKIYRGSATKEDLERDLKDLKVSAPSA